MIALAVISSKTYVKTQIHIKPIGNGGLFFI
nr:MAG TPA: hypothetical protein [Caudoviricetes sp.]